jgi:hypothetical protein
VLQNATVEAAAAVCNVNVSALTAELAQYGKGNCPALTNATRIAKVVYI